MTFQEIYEDSEAFDAKYNEELQTETVMDNLPRNYIINHGLPKSEGVSE